MYNCCTQVQSQRTSLNIEHIIFYNDCGYGGMEKGMDRHRHQCRGRFGVLGMRVPPMNELTLRDWGTSFATGDYVCYWNYGNYLMPDAANIVHGNVQGYEVGITQCTCWFTQDYRTIPQWNGHVKKSDIHYACCCFKREAIQQQRWEGTDYLGAEYRVVRQIEEAGGKVNFCPRSIGTIQGHY